MDRNNLLALPMVLDPHFKLCVFSKSASGNVSVKRLLIAECEDLSAACEENNPGQTRMERRPCHQQYLSEPTSSSSSSSKPWDCFHKIVDESISSQTSSSLTGSHS
jgi:hypothetical protein